MKKTGWTFTPTEHAHLDILCTNAQRGNCEVVKKCLYVLKGTYHTHARREFNRCRMLQLQVDELTKTQKRESKSEK